MIDVPPFTTRRLPVLHRPPWWKTALSLVPLLSALVFSQLPYLDRIGWLLFISGLVGSAFLLVLYARNTVEPVIVRAGADGIAIGDRFHTRAELLRGVLVPTEHRVLLHRRFRRPLVIEATGADEAHALLLALGLDASQTVADFRALSPLLAQRSYLAIAALGLIVLWAWLRDLHAWLGGTPAARHGSLELAVGGILVAATLALLTPMRVRVGADGIALRWLGTRRFVGFDEIEDIERFALSLLVGPAFIVVLRIVVRSKEKVLVPVVGHRGVAHLERLQARSLRAERGSRQGDADAAAALLRRGDREGGAWVTALRSLGAGANAGPRTALVPRDRLLRIVEDAALPALERAAAAVALATELDEEGHRRLRTAAQATALPGLRIAIETAARGAAEAELAAALVEIEEDGAARGRGTRAPGAGG